MVHSHLVEGVDDTRSEKCPVFEDALCHKRLWGKEHLEEDEGNKQDKANDQHGNYACVGPTTMSLVC
ncbi:hypothetical protein HYALB_00008955 [Hymenoscyphus albidus]|uniref:Uncharacterized protein n=1 Tax=Hymenoscyphus albidus TaxID=595503 RepID=A0A9N9LJG4_9HELO|nr:hypothetical protein HYALB_00008955 [Hymenoscyphus albidus]